ncbi:diguanylate cyclase (GGDEF) domain-containing protein [Lachnospiraceae bacterium XBB1006]|nr:diguanylate cyclase (GGDEF) domain-containing protein [Lachnospiraceae bacterium XBB1006]
MNKEMMRRFEYAHQKRNTDPNLCLTEGQAIVDEGKRLNDYDMIAHGEYLISHGMFQIGHMNDVLKYSMSAAAFFEKSDNYIMHLRCTNMLGIGYSAKGQHTLSLQCYKEAYYVAKKRRMYKMYDLLENNIGSEYANLEANETAVRYLKKVYHRMKHRTNVDNTLYMVVLYNLADCYAKLEEYEKAEYYLQVSDEIVKETQDANERGMLALLHARVAYFTGREEEGNRYADELNHFLQNMIIRNFEILGDVERIALHQISIGEFERANVLSDYLTECAKMSEQSSHAALAYRVHAYYYEKIDDKEKSIQYFRLLDEEMRRMTVQERKFQLQLDQEREKANERIAQLRNEMEKQVIFQSRDGLTGLLNRAGFSAIMNSYIEQAKTQQVPVGCIFIDVDHFKEYNDTYGHVNGDACLEKISDVCLKIEKHKERLHFARFGGDEILGMMIGYREKDVVQTACEVAKGVKELNIPHSFEKETGRVSISLGVINQIPEDDMDLLGFMKCLDKTLYESKAQGRNCIHVLHTESGSYECIEVESL